MTTAYSVQHQSALYSVHSTECTLQSTVYKNSLQSTVYRVRSNGTDRVGVCLGARRYLKDEEVLEGEGGEALGDGVDDGQDHTPCEQEAPGLGELHATEERKACLGLASVAL